MANYPQPIKPRPRERREDSAGGVVIRSIDGRIHVLLIKDPYKNWGLPKGHLEEGETSVEAALREVTEETGLSDLHLGPELGTIDWHFRQDGEGVHKFCVFFLMRSERGETIPEEREGISECVWAPLEEAASRITYDNARSMILVAERLLEEEGSAHDG
ncbi:MAG TPA: NUDIX hydrolase [Longimicrobiales bacterium]|jgi:ADP-ribose pyrophosphatase YjhB (NUDIX family)